MPRHQRNVNVATLADWLAVVHSLKNGKKPGMFLNEPRKRIEITRPGVWSEGTPLRSRVARCANGVVDIGNTALSDPSEFLAIRGIDRVKIFSRCRRPPRTPAEKSKAPVVTLPP